MESNLPVFAWQRKQRSGPSSLPFCCRDGCPPGTVSGFCVPHALKKWMNKRKKPAETLCDWSFFQAYFALLQYLYCKRGFTWLSRREKSTLRCVSLPLNPYTYAYTPNAPDWHFKCLFRDKTKQSEISDAIWMTWARQILQLKCCC